MTVRHAPGAPARSLRPLDLRGLALAGTALAVLAGSAQAQTWTDPTTPANRIGSRPSFGQDTGSDGLPVLRGSGRPASGAGGAFGQNAQSGERASGETPIGLSGGGEGLSRLPRFRSGGQNVTSLGDLGQRPGPSQLRQRAAPPRRFGSATRQLTRQRTQGVLQDLRLTPVVQNPVSGVPLPGFGLGGGLNRLPRLVSPLGLGATPGAFFSDAFAGRPTIPDPAYAPLGIKLGTFTILPAFAQSVGYDSNPAQLPRQLTRDSAVLFSEAEVAFASDWSSSALTGELRGGYSEFPGDPPSSRPVASGITQYRLDVTRETRVDLDARFLVDTQRLGSPDLRGAIASAAAQRPLFASFGTSAALAQTFNRIQVVLRGSIDRQIFEDTRLPDGTAVIQSDRNANQYTLSLRTGYEITPALTPFTEVLVDTRVYDSPVDQLGFRRDSDGIAFLGGATFEMTRTLAGEVSGGLQRRDYIDPALRNILAPIVNAALIWSASPLTTVRFNHQTGILETAIANSSGAFTQTATLEVQHDLLRNLSLVGALSFINIDYQGVDIRERGFSTLLRADYRFNRWLMLRGSYVYQQLASTAPLSSFDNNVFLLGVRINP